MQNSVNGFILNLYTCMYIVSFQIWLYFKFPLFWAFVLCVLVFFWSNTMYILNWIVLSLTWVSEWLSTLGIDSLIYGNVPLYVIHLKRYRNLRSLQLLCSENAKQRNLEQELSASECSHRTQCSGLSVKNVLQLPVWPAVQIYHCYHV